MRSCAICGLCTAHTLENCAKSVDRNVPSFVRYSNAPWSSCKKKKGGAKNTDMLKKLCIKNGTFWVSFISSDVTCGAMCGVRSLPSPGRSTHLSNSLKNLCAPLVIGSCYEIIKVIIPRGRAMVDSHSK